MTSHFCRVITWPLLVGVAACTGGELSRSQATEALTARINGPVGSIRIFRARCVEKYFEKYPIRFIEDAEIARHHRLLEEAGLATSFVGPPTPEQCGTPYPESLRVIGITLTAKGATEHWPEHQERGGGWDVPLARRELIEVRNILPQSDATIARVEFTWRTIPTAGGAALGQTSAPRDGTATFRRDNSGWRFVRLGY